MKDSEDEEDVISEELEVHKGKNVEAKGISQLQDKISYLLAMARYIPEEQLQRYNMTVMELGIQIGQNIQQPTDEKGLSQRGASAKGYDFAARRGLFELAVVDLVQVHKHSNHIYIDDLLHMPIDDWKQLHRDIKDPFTKSELISFCSTLDMENEHFS